jgi:leucyl aminopeptidase
VSPSGPTITVRKAAPAQIKADALVIGVHPNSGGGVALAEGAEAVDAAFEGRLTATLATLGATGKAEEISLVPSGGAVSAPLVVAVGLGSDSPTSEQVRRAAGAVSRRLAGKAGSVAYAVAGPAELLGALAEGALLGAYAFDQYRSNGNGRKRLGSITVLTEQSRDAGVKRALARAQAVARAVNLTRDWINMPASDFYPAEFAKAARSEGKKVGLDVEILDHKELAAGGYGGILGVGKGSERPPRLVKLAYRHPKAKVSIAFVGKGITFDTGGISLKPNEGMLTMKCDMSGAAGVLAAVTAIAELELPVNVTAWAPMAENMPSGAAQRPSDVLTIRGGKTVEVLNTDAEGRLVLADGLVRAGEDKPDVIVDVATLTGACMIALGNRVFGIMSNDDGFAQQVKQTADQVGETAWPLPIPEDARERLDSKIADLANVASGRYGGALVAAAFLREFVADGVRWAHLDIAGPAFNDGAPWGYTPAGGTGCGVRTLVGLAEAAASGDL